MSAEVLQKVCAALDGGIEIEALHAAGGAGDEAVALGEHHRGLIESFHEARRHDTHHALVPLRAVHYGCVLAGESLSVLHHLERFGRDFAVDILAVVIVFVDPLGDDHGLPLLFGGEQFHGETSAFHSAGCVDARTQLEHDIVDAHVSRLQVAQVHESAEAVAGILVEGLEAVVGEHAVFAGHENEVRGDTHGAEVQQRFQRVERDAVLLGIALHQLEAHSAAAEVVEGIAVVRAFRVQHRHCGGKFLLGKMVVAHDHVDALLLSEADLLYGLDSAVQRDDEGVATFLGGFDTLDREAVAFVVAVGNIKVDGGGIPLDEGVHQRNGGGAVHVVVAVNEDLFPGDDGLVQPFHGDVEVFHEEGVVEVFQAGPEELARLLEGFDAALHQQLSQDPVDSERQRKGCNLFGIGFRCYVPLCFH